MVRSAQFYCVLQTSLWASMNRPAPHEIIEAEARLLSDAQLLALAIPHLPSVLSPRLNRLVSYLEANEDNASVLRQRNELIRYHDRTFCAHLASRRERARQIARDIKQAASLASPTTPALASALTIYRVGRDKALSSSQIFNVIS